MLTYFLVMTSYGFKLGTLINLNDSQGYFPNPTDVYNPSQPNFGNTNYGWSG